MSQVYSTEPPTSGRVVLRTSHGPLDVNLWCGEFPSACRSFLQLCIDGYYDDTVFHRIMDGFLIQAGKLRYREGSGKRVGGGERKSGLEAGADPRELATYLRRCDGDDGAGGPERAKLELSARVRFNHRGQVAMALPLDRISSDDASAAEIAELRPQFFITLDEAPFLDGKHVIFGTVSGPTVFNALRIGKVEADADTGMPLDIDVSPPPRIEGVKVDTHPFEDLFLTDEAKVPWKKRGGDDGGKEGKGSMSSKMNSATASDVKKRRKKRKGKRDLNVLSFGDEERELEDDDTGTGGEDTGITSSTKRGGGMGSSHDVVGGESSKFLSSSVDETVQKAAMAAVPSDDDVDERRNRKSRKRARAETGDSIEEKKGGVRMAEVDGAASPRNGNAGEKGVTDREEEKRSSRGADGGRSSTTAGRKHQNSGLGHDSPDALNVSRRSEDRGAPPAPKVSEVEARRAKYLSRGEKSRRAAAAKSGARASSKAAASKREEDVLARLSAFRGRMQGAKAEGKTVGTANSGSGAASNGGGDDDDLAARMASRHDRSRREMADAEEADRKADVALTYRGQVMDEDSPDEDADGKVGWMSSQFRCRGHIDHASKNDESRGPSGGDGRDMDDYVVIDSEGGRGRVRGERDRQNGSRTHRPDASGGKRDDSYDRGGSDSYHRGPGGHREGHHRHRNHGRRDDDRRRSGGSGHQRY